MAVLLLLACQPLLLAPGRPALAPQAVRRSHPALQLSSGLTFDDGEQILISAQKPLGLLLEESDSYGGENGAELCGTFVAGLDESGSAGRAGVQAGDILLAVNNQDVARSSLEAVMARLAQAPRVVNLRFRRPDRPPAEG
jgi:S1-C subfamily serine protease